MNVINCFCTTISVITRTWVQSCTQITKYTIAGPTITNIGTWEAFTNNDTWEAFTLLLLPPSESDFGSTNWTLFKAGRVHRPISNDDDELDLLFNNVHLNQTWMVVILVMWILLWYCCLWLLGLPQTNCTAGQVRHSLRGATEKGARRKVCQWLAFSTQNDASSIYHMTFSSLTL